MRQATIGDDGRIYDADGNAAEGPKRPVHRKSHVPMLKNKPRQRGGFYRSLGQASVSVLPSAPASTPGVAYRQAVRAALPLSQGFTFTRAEGDPKTQVFPGMFVVSDRYPGNLFRVAFRPATNNNEALTRLAIMEGAGAGDYVEVLVQPDGSTNPSLLGDFKMVPMESYEIVEYSLQRYPEPQIPGGSWKAEFHWVYFAIDQASYMMSTLNASSTPVAFGTAWADLFSQTASALSFIVDAVDALGWSFDFGKIGQKELKIFTKISSDIFSKIVVMYDLLDPASQTTIFKTADGDKVETFQRKADEMGILRPYWATMLARASLYNQQATIMNAWMAKRVFERGLDLSASAIASLNGMKEEVIAAISDPSAEGAVPPADARTQIDALVSEYQASYSGIEANMATFDAQWNASELKDYSPKGLFTFSSIYDVMLKENADLCMEIREEIKGTLSGANSETQSIEGMGQASAFVPPVEFSVVLAMLGPGLDLRKKASEAVKKDFLALQDKLEKGNISRDQAVNIGRDKIAGLRQQVEVLRAKYSDVSGAVPIRTVERPASELNRSVMKLVSPEDAAAREEGRKAVRQIPSTPEGAIRQGLDQLVNKLADAERLFEGIVTDEQGNRKDPGKYTTEDLAKRNEMRNNAAKLLGDALTQSFVEIHKEKDGTETIVNIMTQGLTDAKGDTKQREAFDIMSTVVDSAIDSNMFSPNAIAGIGRIVADDVGLSSETLSNKYHAMAGELREQIDNLKWEKTVADPRTGESVPRQVPLDPQALKRLQGKLDSVERLSGVFASAETAEALLFEHVSKIDDYRQVVEGSPGRMVPATFEAVAEANGVVGMAVATAQQAEMLQAQVSGATAIPEFQAVLKSDKNSKLTGALANAMADLNSKVAKLKEYTGAKGQTLMNQGQLGLKELADAMEGVTNSINKLRDAQQAILDALKEQNAQRIGVRVMNLFKKLYGLTAPVETVEFGKKSSFGSVIALVLVGTLRLGVAWGVAQLIFLPFGVHIGNPIKWVSDIIEGLTGLLLSRRVGDVAPHKDQETGSSSSFSSSFFVTALAISMIFFGKQLFPVVGEIVRTIGSGLKTVNQLIPWAKKKGKRGRPSEGGEPEKKLRGRGAPIEVDQAVIDLDEARAGGDAREEERIIKKLKRAAERGQTVPPGLWGYYRR